MAAPRAGYDPLNPLSLHSESRYRNGNYSLASETQVFEGFIGTAVRGGGRLAVKGGGKIGRGFAKAGRGIKGLFSRGGSKTAAKVGDDVAEELTEAGLSKGAVQAGEEVAKEGVGGGTKLTLKSVGEGVNAFPIMRIGAGVGMVVISVGLAFGLNDTIEAVTENFTGLNCDDKAKDAGLTEGSEDYKNYVEDCQKTAARNLNILGTASIVGVGLIGFLLFKKYLPKKGSDKEEKEESDESEE